jgi:hypothetical protein
VPKNQKDVNLIPRVLKEIVLPVQIVHTIHALKGEIASGLSSKNLAMMTAKNPWGQALFKDGPKKDFVKKDGVKKDWSGKKPEGRSEAPASGGKKFFGDKTNSRTGPSQGPFRPRRTAA